MIYVIIHTVKPEVRSLLKRAHITKQLIIKYDKTSIKTNYEEFAHFRQEVVRGGFTEKINLKPGTSEFE